MIVNEQKPIGIDNICGAIFNEEDLIGAILWYTDKPVCQTKTVYMHGHYPAVSIYDEKIHIHRLLAMFWMERDLEPNEHVHHVDGNRKNAMQTNLRLINASEHIRSHLKGRKQSPEHVARRTASMKRTRYENPDLIPPSA
jgi:hypothetical protein